MYDTLSYLFKLCLETCTEAFDTRYGPWHYCSNGLKLSEDIVRLREVTNNWLPTHSIWKCSLLTISRCSCSLCCMLWACNVWSVWVPPHLFFVAWLFLCKWGSFRRLLLNDESWDGQELRVLIAELKSMQQMSAKEMIKSMIKHYALFIQ